MIGVIKSTLYRLLLKICLVSISNQGSLAKAEKYLGFSGSIFIREYSHIIKNKEEETLCPAIFFAVKVHDLCIVQSCHAKPPRNIHATREVAISARNETF